jgi:putative transposase
VRYAWIQEQTNIFPTALMCKVLGVSRSGYYGWRSRERSAREKKRLLIEEQAKRFHKRSHRIYGYRKVHMDIIAETNLLCCPETVRRIMRKNALFSCVKRKFVTTTDSKHRLTVAPNLLNRNFTAMKPNQKWVADITYVHTHEGWLYLAGIMDLFQRGIVGWAMSSRIDTSLVCDALDMAITNRRPEAGLVHHSDRGVQYASSRYQSELDKNGILCSMSRKGNCWDNACKESFFGKLKNEWIRGRIYRTREEARREIFWYIEVFYNRVRRHASLGYVSPAEYEARILRKAAA